MSFGYSDIVVAITEVNFHINCGTAKLTEEVVDEGNGVVTLFCDSIECSVINAKVKSTIFLGE